MENKPNIKDWQADFDAIYGIPALPEHVLQCWDKKFDANCVIPARTVSFSSGSLKQLGAPSARNERAMAGTDSLGARNERAMAGTHPLGARHVRAMFVIDRFCRAK